MREIIKGSSSIIPDMYYRGQDEEELAKRHLRKFNGVPIQRFPLFLKECEWRFNNPKPRAQLAQLKQWVKQHMG